MVSTPSDSTSVFERFLVPRRGEPIVAICFVAYCRTAQGSVETHPADARFRSTSLLRVGNDASVPPEAHLRHPGRSVPEACAHAVAYRSPRRLLLPTQRLFLHTASIAGWYAHPTAGQGARAHELA